MSSNLSRNLLVADISGRGLHHSQSRCQDGLGSGYLPSDLLVRGLTDNQWRFGAAP